MDLQRQHQLQSQLRHLSDEARLNQEKLRRFQAFELALLGRTGIDELTRTLLDECRQRFGITHVTLSLHDPRHDFRQSLLREGSDLLHNPWLRFDIEPEQLEVLYPEKPYRPRLQPFRYREFGHLFPGARGHDRPRSMALLPLVRRGELFGSLNLGSPDDQRYHDSHRTDFLGHFAAIVSSCFENELNHERLRHMTLTDPLTGVTNRRYFDRRLPEEVARATRHRDPLSLMFLDLDRFKQVNDNHGHQAGDQLLREAAGIMTDQLRVGDTLARYGGEEFVALLPRGGQQDAQAVAERIRSRIERHRFACGNGIELQVTVSIGISVYRPDERQVDIRMVAEALVADADTAVYLAKEGGRNRIVVAEIESS